MEIALIPVLLGFAIIALMALRPVTVSKTDLSALYLYWPEAYRQAEAGIGPQWLPLSCAAVNRTVVLNGTGLAYKILNVTCLWRS